MRLSTTHRDGGNVNGRKVIFLHSLFRSGSTYMFNKFRRCEKFHTYYEPLHHDLVKLRKDKLAIWKYGAQTAETMKHPELNKPHFQEFSTAFLDGCETLPFFDSAFAYQEFFGVESAQRFSKYIGNLVATTPEEKIPVLQFNRTSMRMDWFRKNHPGSLNLFLLRNPRDQFDSYLGMNTRKKNVFLAINVYIVLASPTVTSYLIPGIKRPVLRGDPTDDLKKCLVTSRKLSTEKHYEIFYYLWSHSLTHARQHADLVLDMDALNTSKDHRAQVKQCIGAYSGETIAFDGYKMKGREVFPAPFDTLVAIEKRIHRDFGFDFTHGGRDKADPPPVSKTLLGRLFRLLEPGRSAPRRW